MFIAMPQQEKLKLIDMRIDAGFDTQNQLAQAAGVSHATVWLAENGRTISYRSARKMINALRKKGLAIEMNDLDWHISETA